jgi:hypothetical protein
MDPPTLLHRQQLIDMESVMKLSIIFFLLLGSILPLGGQSLSSFDLRLDTMTIPGLPGLHSFAVATHAGKWLLIGGRRDGMHQKFNAFGTSGANQQIYVVAPELGQVWQRPLSELPDTLREQLSSTNMEFFQHHETLLFVGGYGRSEVAQNHITYPYLTLVDVPALMNAVTSANGTALIQHFQQIRDTFFAVTGGQLLPLADTFYLVGGHRFDGVYSANSANPTQFYTNAIRKFTLESLGNDMRVVHKSESVDELNLHRRDYNLTPQVFQNGENGLTAFSGVFQPGIALAPFLNIVEITPSGHAPVNGFNQYLANYHCAKIPLWAQSANETHTLFFGGISGYWLDGNDSLRKDNRLPFVKTISRVSRLQNGKYEEVPFAAELPWYTGTSAEFMLADGVPTLPNGMVDYDLLPMGEQLLGYIVGGIVTPDNQPNPFVTNTVGNTSASIRLIKVFLEKKTTSNTVPQPLNGYFDLGLTVSPNPAIDFWNVSLNLPRRAHCRATLQDALGRIVQRLDMGEHSAGAFGFDVATANLSVGAYWLTVNVDGVYMETKTVLKQ